MKLYVKATSSYRSDKENIDIKKELKQRYKIDVRRKESFIYAGLLGALRLKEQHSINKDDELYLTSGFGNIDILAKANDYILEKHETIRLFDFINMLGNTTNFYIAKALDIQGKSIFAISDNFTYFHVLTTIYASLLKNKNKVIFGAIDLALGNPEALKRIAGIDEETEVIDSIMYQYLSLDTSDALCELEIDSKFYTQDEIVSIVEKETREIVYSKRCDKSSQDKTPYFETHASFVVNEMIEKSQDCLYIECYKDRYKVLKITTLR